MFPYIYSLVTLDEGVRLATRIVRLQPGSGSCGYGG